MTRLRDLGNTVIVVEHDEEAIRTADHIVDIGPGAGVHGGRVVAQGSVEKIIQATESITGQFLSKQRNIAVPKKRQTIDKESILRLKEAQGNNLKSITLDLPIGLMTCITGVSGSGKSTLICKRHSLPFYRKSQTRFLCKWITEGDDKRQILVTVHNPTVLDGLALQDDRIRLFTVNRNNRGHTEISRVTMTEEILTLSHKKNWPLSRLWVMGHLGGVPNV